MKISVLVPCYNNAKWMRGCLQSIADQTLTDIEVLLADDGSTDPEAIAIIDEFVERDKRFKLDRHENIGCGKSLNRLFKMATGEYIAEIDGDDMFFPDALEKLYALSDNGRIDFIKGSYVAELSDRNVYCNLWPERFLNIEFKPRDLDLNDQLPFFGSTPALWCGIYRRQFMIDNNIHWLPTEGALYQDTSVSLLLKVLASSAVVTNEMVYRYNLCNDASSMKRDGNFFALANEYDAVERVLKARHINIWEVFGRIRFSGYNFMLPRVKEEELPAALAKFRADMSKEIIYREFYTAEELEALDRIYVKRLC